jgi:MoaA/NifB/PqqE/SkfB family radical SAM enzyme
MCRIHQSIFPEKYDKICLLGDMIKAFKLSPKRYGSFQRITDMQRDAERREAEQREAEDYFANSQVCSKAFPLNVRQSIGDHDLSL